MNDTGTHTLSVITLSCKTSLPSKNASTGMISGISGIKDDSVYKRWGILTFVLMISFVVYYLFFTLTRMASVCDFVMRKG
jgi:hypothetical protein